MSPTLVTPICTAMIHILEDLLSLPINNNMSSVAHEQNHHAGAVVLVLLNVLIRSQLRLTDDHLMVIFSEDVS